MKTSESQQATISAQSKKFLDCVLKLRDVDTSVLVSLCAMHGEDNGNKIYWAKFIQPYNALKDAVDGLFMESVHYQIDQINKTEI